ncbi:8-oxoguanine DNA glycosylase [Alkalibaculum sp. M08DMB]|uniref:DNA-(apurinic or apyrimidinic site) lyase n=1 Tax=Alkalibaculum sporogenes TaxID=2655001 RepID=A0A6A7K6A4_9FIRM|nr:DNA glycosylase [Alkalibaculum sporogenes]MPW24894.1 8-oxoguanine DNA glycosylase [Alkalibaculum sporogenes]
MIKELIESNSGLTLKVDCLNLQQTFECGQCFRWDINDEGNYIGIANNKVIEIRQNSDYVDIVNINKQEFNSFWHSYFDLNRDYQSLINKISNENVMIKATGYGSGIRLLNQDEWETLISFIISANNNIPRIKSIIQSFCESFGDKLYYNGRTYYSFPTPQSLKGITVADLDQIKSGYRAKYIVDAVNKVNEGVVDLYKLSNISTEEARKELLKIKGVGPKVADCILLFSMSKYDCYPMDVWIKRVTENYYFNREASSKEIQELAQNYWGDNAGFAQQYLFYYARNNM